MERETESKIKRKELLMKEPCPLQAYPDKYQLQLRRLTNLW